MCICSSVFLPFSPLLTPIVIVDINKTIDNHQNQPILVSQGTNNPSSQRDFGIAGPGKDLPRKLPSMQHKLLPDVIMEERGKTFFW